MVRAFNDGMPPPQGDYGRDVRERAFRFACSTVVYCRNRCQEPVGRILVPQLIRCATSIGANLEEARGAESRKDFISKCSIALKEARETSFRLRVFCSTCEDSRKQGELLLREAEELAAILGAIVRNARLTQFTKHN